MKNHSMGKEFESAQKNLDFFFHCECKSRSHLSHKLLFPERTVPYSVQAAAARLWSELHSADILILA